MEVAELISVLRRTIVLLQNSQTSAWAGISVDEIVQELEIEITRAKCAVPIDANQLKLLYAPTGAIQETAIDNGWGDEFLRLADVVDRFRENH